MAEAAGRDSPQLGQQDVVVVVVVILDIGVAVMGGNVIVIVADMASIRNRIGCGVKGSLLGIVWSLLVLVLDSRFQLGCGTEDVVCFPGEFQQDGK